MEIRKAMRIARGRALRISIPGILLVAIVGKGAVVRGAVSWGCGTGVAKLTAAFRTSDLSAGPHAVDYYVYRLRRLII